MKFSMLVPAVQRWIASAVAQGHSAESIAESLIKSGHPDGIREAVSECMANGYGDALAPSTDSCSIVSAASSTQLADEQSVQILLTLNAPRIVLLGNLLSDEECDALIERSRQRLKPSTVVSPVDGGHASDAGRTSYGASFKRGEDALITRIEQRISKLLSIPISQGEPIQILRYAPGAEYRPHFDFFDPLVPGNARPLAMGGQRFATLVMYLNDVEAGGSTVFPTIGLDVLPRKGGAVFFAYATPNGDLDRNSLHGGSPVVAGEKWIATKWLRLGVYTGPGAGANIDDGSKPD